jgi:hypothetical protein
MGCVSWRGAYAAQINKKRILEEEPDYDRLFISEAGKDLLRRMLQKASLYILHSVIVTITVSLFSRVAAAVPFIIVVMVQCECRSGTDRAGAGPVEADHSEGNMAARVDDVHGVRGEAQGRQHLRHLRRRHASSHRRSLALSLLCHRCLGLHLRRPLRLSLQGPSLSVSRPAILLGRYVCFYLSLFV